MQSWVPQVAGFGTWELPILCLRNSRRQKPSKRTIVLLTRSCLVRLFPRSLVPCLFGFVVLFSGAVFPAPAQSPPKSTGKPHPGAAATHVPAQSGSFTVNQLGHAVGTAEFHFAPTPGGYDAASTVHVSMQGLEYALSKTEQLDPARHLEHVVLSAIVNGQAVNVTGKPDNGQFLLNISANGRSSTTRLAGHGGTVFVPDFDPGALQALLAVATAQNGRDLWAILPKQQGTIEAVQLATYADEQGTLDGKPVIVHHLVATIAAATTDLFSGDDNQLLQAELAQQGFSLIRKGFVLTPPRRPGVPPPASP